MLNCPGLGCCWVFSQNKKNERMILWSKVEVAKVAATYTYITTTAITKHCGQGQYLIY